jgi:hypothetical protein
MKGYINYLHSKIYASSNRRSKEHMKYMQLNEQYNSLYHRLKTIVNQKPIDIADADRKNLLGKSIFSILESCGKPDYYTSNKKENKTHEIVLFKKRLYGYKSKVIYHFINKKLVAIMYRIQTSNSKAASNDLHLLILQQFGLDIYQMSHALLKDKNENMIELNAQHDIHIDIFYNPIQLIKYTENETALPKTRLVSEEITQRGFSPFEFTFL